MVWVTAGPLTYFVNPTSVPQGVVQRCAQGISNKPQRIKEVALAGSIGADQKHERTKLYVTGSDALVIPQNDPCQKPRIIHIGFPKRGKDALVTMKLLVLGGTIFLGRHLVEAALARGHRVTLFNRGRHNPELFPTVEKLRGERDGDLHALRGRRWDGVIDTSGYLPRAVQASAQTLDGTIDHYTFISTISVYADLSRPGTTEEAPLRTLPDDAPHVLTGETYGPLKAGCERVLAASLPGRALIIRPGLIVGPYDPTGRFTYSPRRIALGGEVLAPGSPDRSIQFIDARDLADWIVRLVEARRTGVFNGTGPAVTLTMRQFLEECRRVSGSDSRLAWVDDHFLLQAGVVPWSELPLWIPESPAEPNGFLRVSHDRAIAAGLTSRPLAETIRDTLVWDHSAGGATGANVSSSAAGSVGLDLDRERRLLAAWHQQRRCLGHDA